MATAACSDSERFGLLQSLEINCEETKDSDFSPDIAELSVRPLSVMEALRFAVLQENLPQDGYVETVAASEGMRTFVLVEDGRAVVVVNLRYQVLAESWFPDQVVACADVGEGVGVGL